MVFGFSLLYSLVILSLFHFLPLKRLEDVPNHRSMHSKPIKRSAGFIFFLVFGVQLFFFVPEDTVSIESKYIFIVPTWFLSFLGLLDDLYNLSSKLKLVLELIFIYIFTLILPFPISIFGVSIPGSLFFDKILMTLFIVFIINVTNFMDGLDLYLSITYFLAITISFIYLNLTLNDFLFISILLLSSMGAFFYFNFPDAKMFMGDSGSLPLGFLLAMAPFYIQTTKEERELGILFLLIPVFLLDGVFTLLKRFLEKKNIFSAHREHLYQRVQTEKKWSKIKTVTIFSCMNLISLFSYLLLNSYFSLIIILLISTTILAAFYIFLFNRLQS
jgi:UDP-N-acetylmuramyl pentapeptide phosphotransferase/UDP-N-acetylglucosamine-1-phosphate transferase